ncbi:MAG: hypothetical protein J7K63_04615 [Candidatus Marinimicrobia bacterium]|nr:hypothetical protein [Candidatus Neomarinimicrobiota bacterium]
MIIPFHTIRTKTSRQFVLILLGFLIVYQVISLFKGNDPNPVLLITTGSLALLFLLPAVVIRSLFWVVTVITGILGTVLTFLLLSLIFFLLIFPLGFFRRILGRSPLDDRFKKGNQTYWRPVHEQNNDMTKQY